MICCFYGSDEYSLQLAVRVLMADQTCQKIPHTTDDDLKTVMAALRQYTLTHGQWLWLQDTTVLQLGKVAKPLQDEFKAALQSMRPEKRLLLTCLQKPNGTLGLTKWLQQNGTVQEFPLTPSWDSTRLTQETDQDTRDYGVRLQPNALAYLVEAVGNQRRERFQALERLLLYQGERPASLTTTEVEAIVQTTASTALRLASQIRERQTQAALGTLHQLLDRNEAPLRILQSLVTQFRTWLWVKSMLQERRHSDLVIAQASGLGNPKRLYYLKQELQGWQAPQLAAVMECLLQAEWSIKQGVDALSTLKTLLFQLGAV
ncbi:DNA polymerase III subunit delta [Phormidium sp. FACHB-592]|uniref:DNA-directed DNA polymerase n=1 Tax=Stenomitos frigidus AS-A4 TaxID=2933935 RepID=A0ABV0KQ42_9CYAN|nr:MULTISPECIES: DNA polymerase III subunit delta [Cyanophyceae]MBD2034071.1 DNA polymerase III subunit delta [Leptolyngbya sp. FACHB-321]MBD2075422.1 DNA polymerase III subunit delta [Phormidium sp. FACHB-592]